VSEDDHEIVDIARHGVFFVGRQALEQNGSLFQLATTVLIGQHEDEQAQPLVMVDDRDVDGIELVVEGGAYPVESARAETIAESGVGDRVD
jgi:hypothetical protein